MLIVEDKGQQAGKHEIKHQWWNCHDVELLQLPLPAGDYILWTDEIAELVHRKAARNIAVKKMDFLGSYNVAVDTKKDMQEIVGNICGVQHARFRDECILAQKNGIKLYVLIENRDHIQSIDDVEHWQNPRIIRYNRIKDAHSRGMWLHTALPKTQPTAGSTLAKAMRTMQEKYGMEFLFCAPEEAGQRIIELLQKTEA